MKLYQEYVEQIIVRMIHNPTIQSIYSQLVVSFDGGHEAQSQKTRDLNYLDIP